MMSNYLENRSELQSRINRLRREIAKINEERARLVSNLEYFEAQLASQTSWTSLREFGYPHDRS